MITGNEPINAVLESWNDDNPEVLVCNDKGLTIRQHFAAMAMQGILANPKSFENVRDVMIAKQIPIDDNATEAINGFCKFAVDMADALIAELNKEK